MSANLSKYMKWAMILILMVICILIPEQGIYTYQVKMFLTITVFGLGLAAFELVPTMFISVVMPSLWVLFKVAPASVVMSPWVGTTFLMILGALMMAATLEDCGLLKRVAFFLMCKVKGSYLALLVSLFFVGVLLNIMTSGRAYLILAPLALGLCISLDGVGKKLGAGLAAAVMIGACQSHVYTFQATGWAVIYQSAVDFVTSQDITALSILLHNWPMLLVSLFTVWIASKLYKPEDGLGEVTYFQKGLEKMGPITKREKVNAVMLIILLIYIFTVGIHKLDVNLGFALIPWMVFLPGLDGADEHTFKRYNFSTVFFVAACMSIGNVAGSLGLGQVLAEASRSLLGGNASPFIVVAIIFLITFGLNFLMTPMAIMALIAAPLCILATEMGYSPVTFMYALNCSIEAILLPYEYVPYLIVFGFGMISMKEFIKFSAIRCVIFLAGMLVVLVPYWMLIGLL